VLCFVLQQHVHTWTILAVDCRCWLCFFVSFCIQVASFLCVKINLVFPVSVLFLLWSSLGPRVIRIGLLHIEALCHTRWQILGLVFDVYYVLCYPHVASLCLVLLHFQYTTNLGDLAAEKIFKVTCVKRDIKPKINSQVYCLSVFFWVGLSRPVQFITWMESSLQWPVIY